MAGVFRVISFSFGSSAVVLDGTLYSMTFQVPAGAAPGVYTVSIGTVSINDADNNGMTVVSKIAGTITVAGN